MADGEGSFLFNAMNAFVFPLKGKNIIILVFGVVMMAAIEILQTLPILWVAGILLSFYLTVYMMRIVATSAGGAETLPDWPEVYNFLDSLLYPWFRFAFVGIICFLPAIIYEAHYVEGAFSDYPVFIALLVLGSLYFPMALACVSVYESVAYINPSIVLPLIFKAPIEYIFAWVLLAATFYLSMRGIEAIGQSGLLIRLLTVQLISFYLSVVEMRIIGLVYRVAESRREG